MYVFTNQKPVQSDVVCRHVLLFNIVCVCIMLKFIIFEAVNVVIADYLKTCICVENLLKDRFKSRVLIIYFKSKVVPPYS